jgi:hypothetical protein
VRSLASLVKLDLKLSNMGWVVISGVGHGVAVLLRVLTMPTKFFDSRNSKVSPPTMMLLTNLNEVSFRIRYTFNLEKNHLDLVVYIVNSLGSEIKSDDSSLVLILHRTDHFKHYFDLDTSITAGRWPLHTCRAFEGFSSCEKPLVGVGTWKMDRSWSVEIQLKSHLVSLEGLSQY